jgi:hypothetical protein
MATRKIELTGIGVELKLSKVTAVKIERGMIHLDELPDGTWRLIYNGNLIKDFSKISALTILRSDE